MSIELQKWGFIILLTGAPFILGWLLKEILYYREAVKEFKKTLPFIILSAREFKCTGTPVVLINIKPKRYRFKVKLSKYENRY